MNRMNLLLLLLACVAVGFTIGQSIAPVAAQNAQSRPHAAPRRGLSPENERALLAFTKEHLPELHKRLENLRDSDPNQYRRLLRNSWPKVREYLAMPEQELDAHLRRARAQVEIYRVSRAYRSADTTEKRDDLGKKLQTLVAEHFDAEQEVYGYRLQSLETQVRKLRTEIETRQTDRKKIIAQRLEDSMSAPAERRRPPRQQQRDGASQ